MMRRGVPLISNITLLALLLPACGPGSDRRADLGWVFQSVVTAEKGKGGVSRMVMAAPIEKRLS